MKWLLRFLLVVSCNDFRRGHVRAGSEEDRMRVRGTCCMNWALSSRATRSESWEVEVAGDEQ